MSFKEGLDIISRDSNGLSSLSQAFLGQLKAAEGDEKRLELLKRKDWAQALLLAVHHYRCVNITWTCLLSASRSSPNNARKENKVGAT